MQSVTNGDGVYDYTEFQKQKVKMSRSRWRRCTWARGKDERGGGCSSQIGQAYVGSSENYYHPFCAALDERLHLEKCKKQRLPQRTQATLRRRPDKRRKGVPCTALALRTKSTQRRKKGLLHRIKSICWRQRNHSRKNGHYLIPARLKQNQGWLLW